MGVKGGGVPAVSHHPDPTPAVPPPDEEEEEEEESDEELPQEMGLGAGEGAALPPDPLEPPAKLPRTDARGLFVQALPSS